MLICQGNNSQGKFEDGLQILQKASYFMLFCKRDFKHWVLQRSFIKSTYENKKKSL